jgi:DMSO/TMAO reductase YedYZ molybdopterin-dependent catalytic subunit
MTGPEGGSEPAAALEVSASIDWTLSVDGLVERPLSFPLSDLLELPSVEVAAPISRAAGWEGWDADDLRWTGVPVLALLHHAGLRPEARLLAVDGGGYVATVALSSIDATAPVLAYRLNGRELPDSLGGPLRLVSPRGARFQSVKRVSRLTATTDTELDTAKARIRARVTRRRTEAGERPARPE